MISLDKSFDNQSGDQGDWKFILQANYFFCYLESDCTNTQRANVQRWILSVAKKICNAMVSSLFQIVIGMFLLECSFG